MSKKAPPTKKKASEKGSKSPLSLTRKQVLLWLGITLFAMMWTFVLGIVVGRGLSPVRFDVQTFKQKLMAEKEKALKKDAVRFKIESESLAESPDLDFYKALKDEKVEPPPKAKEVTIENAKPPVKTSEVVKSKAIRAQGPLTIQVASLKNEQAARDVVARLEKMGYQAYKVTVSLPEDGTYHRVRVGHFNNAAEAKQVATLLQEDDFDVVIIRE